MRAYNKNTQRIIKAFTLAEVLITLGIIGIVAAITIPIIINNSEKQKIIPRVKEDFAILAQATNSITNDCGGDIAGCISNPANGTASRGEVANLYKAKLLLAKDCTDGSRGCFPDVMYKRLDNLPSGNNFDTSVNYDNARLRLANGTSVAFDWNGTGYIYFYVYFDVNGSQGPNQYGKDWFSSYYNANTKTFTPGPANGDCATSNVGASCAVNIIRDGEINYY